MSETQKAYYAVPCSPTEDCDIEDVFFVTFNTTDEKEAMALTKCICGDTNGLLIISPEGEIFEL